MTTSDWLAENCEAIRHLPPVTGLAPECMVVGCGRTVHTHDLCKAHYHRARRMFDPIYNARVENAGAGPSTPGVAE